jgi:hypothetical protein
VRVGTEEAGLPGSQSVVRVGGGLIAFAVVAVVTIGGVFGFDEGSAMASWALVAVIAVPAGVLAYAAIEWRQTGRLESIARQFDTRTLALMPVAIALNIVLGQAVGAALKVPIYLDSIGTILVAALAGPLAGALTGLLSNLLWTYAAPPPFQSATAAPFAIVAVVIGILAGSFARWGWLRPRPGATGSRLVIGAAVSVGLIVAMAALATAGYGAVMGGTDLAPQGDEPAFALLAWLALLLVAGTAVGLVVLLVARRDLAAAWVVVAGVITGIVASVVAAPVAANLFGGVTGGGTDFLVAAFRQAGADIAAATLGQSLISDPIDKVTTFFVAYLVLGAMSDRVKARFPQGDRLLTVTPVGEDGVAGPGAPDDPPRETG